MTFNKKLTAFNTLISKELKRFMRIWIQTLLPPVITTTLYFVIFGSLIGGVIGNMNGVPYSQFIAPGLIMMAIINNSYANVVSSFFGAKFHGNIQEMIISPIPAHIVLLGFISGGVIRGLIVGSLVTLVSLFFTDLRIFSLVIVLSIALLTATLLAIAGFINAYYARTFDGMNIVPVFILGPLTYLGGVFFSIDMLPEFWQQIAQINPILYMVNGFRYGFLGSADIQLLPTFVILILMNIGLYAFALRLLKIGRGILD
ncbi:MAG: ABC transporter permease [Thiotrichaceae bacterium]|nr:ABC transporter permease [Thiotrichaceae bacterium]